MPTKLNPGPFDCMAAALPDEEYMVFLARDPLAPWMLAIWASARVGNLDVALKNFQLMFTGGLLEHFKKHPDNSKSIEAIQIAERMRAWRERNLMPGLTPTWKSSPTERHKQRPVEPEAAKIACGLRQIAENLIGRARREVTVVNDDHGFDLEAMEQYADRINGFAAELELIAGHPLIVVEPLQLEKE